MKAAQKMKLGKSKKTTESRIEKIGPKLKSARTRESKKREKEGNGRVVKSKMNADC